MNIIEKEIAKRQEIVDAKAEKIARIAELKEEIAKLQEEVDATDTTVLEAEIAELKSFLPVPEEDVVIEEPVAENVEEAITETEEQA